MTRPHQCPPQLLGVYSCASIGLMVRSFGPQVGAALVLGGLCLGSSLDRSTSDFFETGKLGKPVGFFEGGWLTRIVGERRAKSHFWGISRIADDGHRTYIRRLPGVQRCHWNQLCCCPKLRRDGERSGLDWLFSMAMFEPTLPICWGCYSCGPETSCSCWAILDSNLSSYGSGKATEKMCINLGLRPEVVGAALVLGPFLGGILLENFGGRSPFAFSAVLGFVALLALMAFVPVPGLRWPLVNQVNRVNPFISSSHHAIPKEYLPPSRRASMTGGTAGAPVLAAFQLLVQNPALRWYTAASGGAVLTILTCLRKWDAWMAVTKNHWTLDFRYYNLIYLALVFGTHISLLSGLFSLGMAVYGTVNVLWLKEVVMEREICGRPVAVVTLQPGLWMEWSGCGSFSLCGGRCRDYLTGVKGGGCFFWWSAHTVYQSKSSRVRDYCWISSSARLFSYLYFCE